MEFEEDGREKEIKFNFYIWQKFKKKKTSTMN